MTSAAILVVDDDEDIREVLVDALSEEGFEACGARDGADALRVLRAAARLPALILLDLMMPGMSGADFLTVQRADPALARVPVVLLSADAHIGAKAATLGVPEFLRKPVKLDALLTTVRRFSKTD